MVCLSICLLLIISIILVFRLQTRLEESVKTKRLTDGIRKLLLLAPVIASIILTILFLTVLKGRLVERTSHALIVLCFWLYGTIFYVNNLKYFKNKMILFLNTIFMLISIAFAIYLTPLDRYCEVMFSLTHEWTYLIGGLMILVWYYLLIQKSKYKY